VTTKLWVWNQARRGKKLCGKYTPSMDNPIILINSSNYHLKIKWFKNINLLSTFLTPCLVHSFLPMFFSLLSSIVKIATVPKMGRKSALFNSQIKKKLLLQQHVFLKKPIFSCRRSSINDVTQSLTFVTIFVMLISA